MRELLEEIVDAVGVDAEIEVPRTTTAAGELVGEDLGLLIGRHGQTIDAIQHLAYRIAYRGSTTTRKRVTVDAAGYRERRASAAAAAMRTRRPRRRCATGEPVALDAMNAVERTVVHEYLRDRDGVETYSEGEEPDRHLVVAPVERSGACERRRHRFT